MSGMLTVDCKAIPTFFAELSVNVGVSYNADIVTDILGTDNATYTREYKEIMIHNSHRQ